MRAIIRWLVVVVLLCGALPAVAQTAGPGKKGLEEQRRFAANNALFVIYHEVAHLLIQQLDLPVLGREEDAADNMASWTLLNHGTARASQTLKDAVRGWFLSGIQYRSGSAESDYAAAYLLDKQRAYQIVCMMVGKDPAAFSAIARDYGLSPDRQTTCGWDYESVDRGLRSVLARHSSRSGRGSTVNLTYHAVTGALRSSAEAFKASGVFDQVADELRHSYNLSTPVRFTAKRCGEANAFYDPDRVEIIFCYELMQDYMKLYADNLPAAGAGQHQSKTRKDKQRSY